MRVWLSPCSFVLLQMLISILYSAVIIGLGTSQLIDMQAAKAEADFKQRVVAPPSQQDAPLQLEEAPLANEQPAATNITTQRVPHG